MLVIFKEMDTIKVTSEKNYNAIMRDARAVQAMNGFNDANEVIEYYCKYFKRLPTDFIVKF